MKRLLNILLLITAALAVSCAREEVLSDGREWSDLERELGLDEPEMPVCLGFDLPFEDPRDPETRASIVGGTEDPDEYIRTLHMACFTKDGIYLGWRQAVLIGDEQIFSHDGLRCKGRELFEGTVPSRTARIHFVGNATLDNIPGNDQIGGNENTLIKSAHMSVDLDNSEICYWGFHGEPNSEKMRDWLAVATTVDGVTTYSKDPNSMIHMIRDRARINFRYMFDFKRSNSDVDPGDVVTVNGSNYTIGSDGKITIDGQQFTMDANPTDYTITQIDWILSNGLDHGYIAPYYEGASDHFDNYYDPAASPQLKEDRLTPYDKSDGRRYTATEADMVTIYKNGLSVDAPLFLFEDLNDINNPPKLILRVQYTRDGKTPITKYHTLMLLNEENDPCKIYRNHSYILDIYGLPWEGLGYVTFADAVNSTTYANNMTVTINDKVPEVNDGRFKLTIYGDTYLIYQNPAEAGQTKEILFTYAVAKAGESTAEMTIDDFKAGWTSAPRPTFAAPDVTLTEVSNDGTTFTGKISYTLGTSIGSNLQSGQIELHDNKTGMSRFVNIYTISKFNFLPDDASQLLLVRDGTATREVNGTSCDTYYMDVRIPGDYPIGLYPIKLRIATKTLNPFKAVRMDDASENTNISVTMEGTENGTLLDGETLSGMDFTVSPLDKKAWNYHAPGSPWNFWFVYEMVNKPTLEQDGETVEDMDDKVFRIYFDDIRPLRAGENQADGIGLFLKIKYFGPAVSVEL